MRKEFKYIVPAWMYQDLRATVFPWLVPDRYACRNPHSTYTVRSIYFDTRRLQAYHEKIDGVSVRQKLRVRGYDSLCGGSEAFLEIKRRFGESGDKDRTAIGFVDLPGLFRCAWGERCCADQLPWGGLARGVQQYLFHIIRQSLMPVVLVTYEREAYQGRHHPGLRLTFDSGMRFRTFPLLQDLYTEDGLRRLSSSFLVMEVKFDRGFPSWLQQILEQYNLTRRTFSKYAACVEASARFRQFTPRMTNTTLPMTKATRMEVVS